MTYFQTIEVFYKILLSNSTDDIQEQIDHLHANLKEESNLERVRALNGILATAQHSTNMEPFRLIKLFRSFADSEDSNGWFV